MKRLVVLLTALAIALSMLVFVPAPANADPPLCTPLSGGINYSGGTTTQLIPAQGVGISIVICDFDLWNSSVTTNVTPSLQIGQGTNCAINNSTIWLDVFTPQNGIVKTGLRWELPQNYALCGGETATVQVTGSVSFYTTFFP